MSQNSLPDKLLIDCTPLDMRAAVSKRGIGFYVNTLLSHWQKRNISNVSVLKYRSNYTSFERKLVFPVSSIPEKYLWMINALLLPSFIERNKIDYFHSTHPCTTIFSKNYKTIATVYDLIPLIFYRQCLAQKWYNLHLSYNYYLKNLERIEHLIAISNTTKQDCVRLLGINEKKITTIYLGVDGNVFHRMTDEDKLQSVKLKYNLPERFFLYAGGLDFRKNYQRLITSYMSVAERIPEHMVMVGSWKNDVGLQKHNKIHYLNFVTVEELAVLYSLSTALVFPSIYEGFGLPVIEAFYCGTPVLCSNTSSLLEIAIDAALLVDPLSIADIARGMEKLSSDELYRKKLTEKGLIRAKDFSVERMSNETLKVYEKIAGC